MTRILADATEAYLDSIRPEVDDLLEEMEARAREERIPIATREVARFQTILARGSDADRVIEFGTAIGYTTIQLARTGCDVVTLELDPDRIAAAEEYVERAGVGDRVTIVEGPALETLPDLDGPFDLAFIDAVKTEYREYLDGVLPMLSESGLVVVDNLLWQGRVPEAARISTDPDDSTEALREFNETFMDDERIESVVLPLGDGTGLGVRR